jgi:hypothetical protein
MNFILIDAQTENDSLYFDFIKKEAGGNLASFTILRIGGHLKNFKELGCPAYLIYETKKGIEAAKNFLDDGQKLTKLIICAKSKEFLKQISGSFSLPKEKIFVIQQ